MKSTAKTIIENIKYFYRYAGNRMIWLFILGLAAGVVELLGIGLLLPILNLGFGNAGTDQISKIFNAFFEWIGYSPTLTTLLILLVSVFILKACATFIIKFFSSVIAVDLKSTIQKTLTTKLSLLSYSHFTQMKSGWLNNVLMKESAIFTQGFSEFVRMQTTMIHIIVYLTTASILRLDIMIILMVVGLPMLFPLKILMKMVRETSKQLTKRSGIVSNGFIELIDHFIYAKATGAIQNFKETLTSKIKRMNYAEKKLLFFSAFIHSLSEPIAVIALATLVYTQVVLGNSQLSEVLILGLLIHRIVGQVMLLQGQWQRFNSTFGSIEVIKKTLKDFENNIEPNNTTKIEKIDDISFNNVNFAYEGKNILKDITLSIPRNKMVGIIGPSGSGKTTIFYLLTGLLPPASGDIKIGDVNYTDIDKESLRRSIGYVPQNPAIIDGTLLENVNFGTFDPDDPTLTDKVKSAMKQAGLNDLTDDLQRQTGERGVQLSGGQKQRIAIARELLRNKNILILDEATSALDEHNDQKVQEALSNLKGHKTIVIISHKSNNIEQCDIVYQIDNGVLS